MADISSIYRQSKAVQDLRQGDNFPPMGTPQGAHLGSQSAAPPKDEAPFSLENVQIEQNSMKPFGSNKYGLE